jgi:hypothetical protein
MEPEGSILCSQEPSTVPILSHINPIHSIPYYLSKIHFNIVHPPTSWLTDSFPIVRTYVVYTRSYMQNCIAVFMK